MKHILGFDANGLYLSTMAKDMPCGKEWIVHHKNPEQAAQDLIPLMNSGGWFGFAEVDIEVPQELWPKFEEFPPLFINKSVGEEGIPQPMKDYLARSGRTAMPDQQKLLGVLSAKQNTAVLSTFEVVSRARPENHSCTSNNLLYPTKDFHLVR